MKKNLIITSLVLSFATGGLLAADSTPAGSSAGIPTVNIPADPAPAAPSAPAAQATTPAKTGKHKGKKHKKHQKKADEKKPEAK